MKFSILVPVYNVEKYLHECLDSIMMQTYEDFEVILVNDGSNDNSALICTQYENQYPEKIKVFHNKNRGLLLTRRFALRHAQGDYVVFVDSDDYVSKELLETLNNAFTEYNSDMVIYNFYRFNDGSSDMSSPNIPFSHNTIFDDCNKQELYESFILYHTFSNMWIKAIKRSCIDIENDYTHLNISNGEDIIQSFELFTRTNKIIYISKNLYYYRKNQGSLTMKIDNRDYKNYLTWSMLSIEYIKKWHLPNDLYYKFYARQMSFFYRYLRDVYSKGIKLQDENYFKNTILNLKQDSRFMNIIHNYDSKYSKKRLVLRLEIMRYGFKYKLGMINLLICISNLLGELKNGNK